MFSEEGVDVTLVSFPTGKLCLDAVIGGNADIATVAGTPIMHAAFANQPIALVATIHRSRENTFVVARKDRGISSPGDLKGKTVGVPFGTNAEYALDAFLTKQAVRRGDLKLINLSPPEMIGPLTRGDVTAVAAWEPHAGRSLRALGPNGVRFSFADVYEETYNLVTRSALVALRLETLAKVLKAVDRAVAYMKEHPDEAIDIVARRIGMEKDELTTIWPIYRFGVDLRASLVEMLTAQARGASERGQQSGPIPDMRAVVNGAPLRRVSPQLVDALQSTP